MKKASWIAALALSAAVASVVSADITGNAKIEGEVPEPKELAMNADAACAAQHADPVMDPSVVAGENGELANVIVHIKAEDPAAQGGEAPTEPVVLDQKGCMYEPHVLTMTVGQDMMVKNSDGFLHNVHSLAVENPAFNFGQPNKNPGQKVPEQPKINETFRVKCDVHPWMSAYIGVFEHPFHAVTGEDGKYTIKGTLPDGEYTLVAWHEKFGEKEEKITVKDGKAEKDFAFTPEAAMVVPSELNVIVTSAGAEKKSQKKSDDACKSCCPADAKAALDKQQPTTQEAAKPVAPTASAQ
jgi:plastocyanin